MLRNPDGCGALVHDQERMTWLARHYADRLDLDVQRVLDFAFAHAGLAASWSLAARKDPSFSLRCAEILAPLAEP